MAGVVNVMVKRRDLRSRQVGMRETSASEPLRRHRKLSDDIETGEPACPGKSMVVVSRRRVIVMLYER
jgi:hypothetical protein